MLLQEYLSILTSYQDLNFRTYEVLIMYGVDQNAEMERVVSHVRINHDVVQFKRMYKVDLEYPLRDKSRQS